jgi:hypothetical protein
VSRPSSVPRGSTGFRRCWVGVGPVERLERGRWNPRQPLPRQRPQAGRS